MLRMRDDDAEQSPELRVLRGSVFTRLVGKQGVSSRDDLRETGPLVELTVAGGSETGCTGAHVTLSVRNNLLCGTKSRRLALSALAQRAFQLAVAPDAATEADHRRLLAPKRSATASQTTARVLLKLGLRLGRMLLTGRSGASRTVGDPETMSLSPCAHFGHADAVSLARPHAKTTVVQVEGTAFAGWGPAAAQRESCGSASHGPQTVKAAPG